MIPKLKMTDVIKCKCGTIMRVADWNSHKCDNRAGTFTRATEEEIKTLELKEKQ